jgi:hypothetical protein
MNACACYLVCTRILNAYYQTLELRCTTFFIEEVLGLDSLCYVWNSITIINNQYSYFTSSTCMLFGVHIKFGVANPCLMGNIVLGFTYYVFVNHWKML